MRNRRISARVPCANSWGLPPNSFRYCMACMSCMSIGEHLLQTASRESDFTRLLGAHEALACTAFHRGAFPQVLVHTERGLRLYEPQHHHALATLYGR
jgi:hypothetical protein